MLGISMSNPTFWRSSIYELLAWQAQHFNVTLLVIGDYLHRHNELMLAGATEGEAAKAALHKGEAFLEHLSLYNTDFNAKSFARLRWQEISAKPAFASALQKFEQLCHTNTKVCESLKSTAQSFVSSRDETFSETEAEAAVQHSLNYLLEELAAFEVLAQEGWEVLAYPGRQLPFFHQLVNNELGELDLALRQCAFIELSVQKK